MNEKVTLQVCKNCGAGEVYCDASVINEAGGFVHCENCNYPLRPSDNDWNAAAVDIAADELRAQGKISYNPVQFFEYLNARRNQLIQSWKVLYADALKTFELNAEIPF